MTAILLQSGTVLSHEGDTVKVLRNHDVLVLGNTIQAIGQGLSLPADVSGRVINCEGKIISPGFIDTHHHLWQSQLRGRFGNVSFMDYMVAGNVQAFNYTPEDIFWGQLSGCQESIHCGVTTVVDHAHMTYSPEHATEAIRATVSSGLRSVFCYTPIWRVTKWPSDGSPVEHDEELLPEWWFSTLEKLAKTAPFGAGRVTLGIGFDHFKLPRERIQDLWRRCRSLGINLFTSHYVANSMTNPIPLLQSSSFLDHTILLSHINGMTASDAETLQKAGAHFSSTPETELQMGLGTPLGFSAEHITRNASVGIDCHCNNSSDLLRQLRLGMQHARAEENARAAQEGQYPSVKLKMQEVFNLGTIQGARAVNMADRIGSIEVGKRADIVVFDAAGSPGMVCAAEEDAVAAVVMHSSVGDVEVVIVDGVVRKEGGRLVDVGVLGGSYAEEGGDMKVLDPGEVSRRLLDSRRDIIERSRGQDPARGLEFLYKTFG
ncbi:hypothetical protein BJX64DRAFT_300098 [Aspergillus heterothallicus]